MYNKQFEEKNTNIAGIVNLNGMLLARVDNAKRGINDQKYYL
jgi:hypothetical protein